MTIRLQNLAMTYGKIDALLVDELRLEPERLYVLTGPNGAGKSTLLQILAGLLEPTSGNVHIDRAIPGSLEARRVVSFIPDLPALFDDLTLDDQLHYIARLHKLEAVPEACLDLAQRIEAEDLFTRFPRSMSKGQRQKASLLVGTARPLTVLLLDEPTSGLDADSRTALIAGLGVLAASGVTVVASTHDEELIEAGDDRIQLDNGKLVTEV